MNRSFFFKFYRQLVKILDLGPSSRHRIRLMADHKDAALLYSFKARLSSSWHLHPGGWSARPAQEHYFLGS